MKNYLTLPNLKTYLPYILCFILGILLFRNCESIKYEKAEKKRVEKENEEIQVEINALKLSNKEFLAIEQKYLDTIAEKNHRIGKLEKKIEDVNKAGDILKEKYKNADAATYAKYWSEKYDTPVTAVGDDVITPKEVAGSITNDLIQGQVDATKLRLQNEILKENQSKYTSLYALYKETKEDSKAKDTIIIKVEEQRDNLQILADSQMKTMKKLRNGSNLKTGGIILAAAASFTLGYYLAK